MTILSYPDLAQRAGVDPWALHAKVAVGDPAEVESLAGAFYKAGGNMSQSNADARTAATYRKQGYTTNGSSPIDFGAEAKATATSPEHLQQIGKVLDTVATDLSAVMRTAGSEVSSLQAALDKIEGEWTSFMVTIGHHLTPDDQQSTRQDFIDRAVSTVKSYGSTINTAIQKYEETIYGAQRSMSALGYTAPATLDDLYGDGAAYVAKVRALARAEADKLKNGHGGNGNAAKIAAAVGPMINDPYFASAFYGELGPVVTQALPDMLGSGSKKAIKAIKTFSHMFGTAVSNQDDDPRMAAVANSFLNTPKATFVAWNRGVMASSGNFPPDWLAKAARYNVLDILAKDGANGFGGSGYNGTVNGSLSGNLGMPQDTVALWTQDLGHNPQAARDALATMGNGDPNDVTVPANPTGAYETNIHKLIEYGKQGNGSPAAVRGYGLAFAAAAGADDEHDGAHSQAAVGFAEALFDDIHHDGGGVGPSAAPYMAKIAGSYVQEMAAGGDQGDRLPNDPANYAVSGIDANGRIAGDHAAFGIPPGLAKEFMKSFVGDTGATKIFDTAAGEAAHHAMLAGAKQDVALLKDGKAAVGFEKASYAYGSVAGSENGAAIQVVGKQVEDAEHSSEVLKSVLSAGIDMIPAGKLADEAGGLAARMSDSVWDAMKHSANAGLENAYSAVPGTKEELSQLKDARYLSAMAGDYECVAILREAGYPGTQHMQGLIAHDGQMINVNTVMQSGTLSALFYKFMHGHATLPEGTLGDGASVHEIAQNAASRYTQGYTLAQGDDDGESGG